MQTDQPDESVPLFSSVRERRLWVCDLVVIAAIYSTLGLASMLVGELLERGLFDGTFVIAFLLMWLAILTQGLNLRPGRLEIGVGLGIAAVYLMVFARLGIPERSHLFEYSIVAVFIHEALTERANQGRRVPLPALIAVFATSLIGVLDECIQAVLPSRLFAWEDMLFNVLASFMGTVANAILGWARQVASRLRSE